MTQDDVPANAAGITRKIRAVGFFPADYASIESGKVYASGAYWGQLNFPAFPAVLPSMALVAVIEVPFHANQIDHTIEINLLDADEKLMGFKVNGTFRSAPRLEAEFGEPGSAPVAVPVQGLTFDKPGRYSFRLKVDNEEIDRYRFRVAQVARVVVVPPFPAPSGE